MSDEYEHPDSGRVYPAWWDTAKTVCLDGHPAGCTYGGLVPESGYWLADDDCTLSHGEMCVACGDAAETGFAGWAGLAIWGVPVCGRHAEEIRSLDPAWTRPAGT